ncbi:MAG: hypothetical protein K8H86_08065 [Ignavibacteriaceae bacterium]|nr:hypothetical protein [Ignavibacteriaceae bacterium]
MKVVISDTNIFIDLISIELLDSFLELDYEIQTTDFVLEELSDEQLNLINKKIVAKKVVVNNADEQDVDRIVELQKTKQTLSLEDFSVFYFARKNGARILTGDKSFRTYAEQNGIAVSGILWIFDEIEKAGVLKPENLVDRLEKLRSINVRLPKDELQKRITKWRIGKAK